MTLTLLSRFRSPMRRSQDLAKQGSQSFASPRPAAESFTSRLDSAKATTSRSWQACASWGRRARSCLPFVIYNCLLALLFPVVAAVFLWQVLLLGRARPGLLQRLGLVRPTPPASEAPGQKRLWFHAVSVGEMIASLPVIRRVYASTSMPLVASVTTPTGRQVAETRLGGLVSGILYFPFDFPLPIRSVLDALDPACLVLMESEIWPNLLFLSNARGTKIAIANGRISDRSLRLARLFKPLYKWALTNVHMLCMQSATDRERAVRLGADPARASVAGNVKFDELESSAQAPLSRADFGLGPEDLVILAGSTHEGEDEQVLDAYWQVRVYFPEARLIIAPRHLHRLAKLEELILARGFSCLRRSQVPALPTASLAEGGPVILVDTMGELASLYSLCSIAFVGGSLVRKGGQNMLQPLAYGKPVLFGPYTENFKEISRMVVEAGLGFRVRNSFELAGRISSLWKDQSLRDQISGKALDFISANKGASAACAQTILELTFPGATK